MGHNVFYHDVGKRLTSRLFLALGSEGKKKFIQKNPHTEVPKLGFREIVRLSKISLEKTKCITYERFKSLHDHMNRMKHLNPFMRH